MQTIQSVTPTLCRLFGVESPSQCSADPIAAVLSAYRDRWGDARLERALIYAPDAIGSIFLARNPAIRDHLGELGKLQVPLRSMLPPKTPVCFASMFSGAPPEVHGIRRYERPTLAIDTLFDALTRNGLKTALVSVKNCSIDRIFRNRPLDYFSETYDPEVTARALELLGEDRFDLIVAYHQEYDDVLHRANPYSTEAVEAAVRHSEAFRRLVEAAAKAWKGRRWIAAATPDHGGHILPDGSGDHGEDIPEDMEVTHFWRV